jgi:hypothetical protein
MLFATHFELRKKATAESCSISGWMFTICRKYMIRLIRLFRPFVLSLARSFSSRAVILRQDSRRDLQAFPYAQEIRFLSSTVTLALITATFLIQKTISRE